MPALPAQKDDKALVYAIIYHIIIFAVGYVAVILVEMISAFLCITVILIPVCFLVMFVGIIVSMLLPVYSLIGIGMRICSYCGVDVLPENEKEPETAE